MKIPSEWGGSGRSFWHSGRQKMRKPITGRADSAAVYTDPATWTDEKVGIDRYDRENSRFIEARFGPAVAGASLR